jgi:hypothetical protein
LAGQPPTTRWRCWWCCVGVLAAAPAVCAVWLRPARRATPHARRRLGMNVKRCSGPRRHRGRDGWLAGALYAFSKAVFRRTACMSASRSMRLVMVLLRANPAGPGGWRGHVHLAARHGGTQHGLLCALLGAYYWVWCPCFPWALQASSSSGCRCAGVGGGRSLPQITGSQVVGGVRAIGVSFELASGELLA